MMKYEKISFSETVRWISAKFHINVSWVNFNPLKSIGFVGWAYFPIWYVIKSLKIFFENTHLVSTKFPVSFC